MGTIFSNTLETVASIKFKKVCEKHAAPWYNSYIHSIKKETFNLERKWRKTNLEVGLGIKNRFRFQNRIPVVKLKFRFRLSIPMRFFSLHL